MTIETATPSSGETIAALFDTLVNAVAARVQAELANNIAAQLEHAMDTWAMTSGVLEDRVNDMVQSFVDNSMDVDDVVRKALDNLDLDDMITTSMGDYIRNNVTISIDTI
jgi:ribosomal protein L11 methylase PrmA